MADLNASEDRPSSEQLKMTLSEAKIGVKEARRALHDLETAGADKEAIDRARQVLKMREHARTRAQLAVQASRPISKRAEERRRVAEERRREHALAWAEELKAEREAAEREAAEREKLVRPQAVRDFHDTTRSSVRAVSGGLPGSKRR